MADEAYPIPEMSKRDAEIVYQRFSTKFRADKVAPDVAHFEGFETVYNRPASPRDVRKLLRRLPLRETLRILATIGVEIERGRHPIDVVLQLRVAQRFGTSSRRHLALRRRLQEETGSVLVSEEQIAVLSCMALSFCNGEQVWSDEADGDFLDALLAYNSVNGAESMHPDTYTALRRTELRSLSTDPERVTDILDRWRAFQVWARAPEAKGLITWLDLDNLCESALGMTYLAWATATWCIMTPLIQTFTRSDGSRRYDPFLEVEGALAVFRDTTALRRFLETTSMSLKLARGAVSEVHTMSLSGFEAFMERPLVSTDWGLYCPVLRFLPNLAGNGMLFRLGRYLDDTGAPRGSNGLRQFYGAFLECYTRELIVKATAARGVRVFGEKQYGKPEMRSSDIAVFDGKAAVFIDVTATRFNVRNTIVGLGEDDLERDLDRFVIHKVSKEIARCARDFRSGALLYDGIAPSDVTDIFGLVVSPQGLPRVVGVNETIDRLMPDVSADLVAWDFYDLNEIELLPRAFPGDLDLPGLIAHKKADRFGSVRSLSNFLIFRQEERVRFKGDPRVVLEDPGFRAILAQAQEWGLPKSST